MKKPRLTDEEVLIATQKYMARNGPTSASGMSRLLEINYDQVKRVFEANGLPTKRGKALRVYDTREQD